MGYTYIELKHRYHETAPQVSGISGAMGEKRFRLDLFYELVERIIRVRSIKRVLIRRRESFSVPAFGGLEEIRSSIQRLKAAGKEVYYYAHDYDTTDCILSSACSRRIIHPLGTVSFPGIALPGLFFKRLIDDLDVDVNIIRRGRYKSAADPFRIEKHDEYSREQYQALTDGTVKAMRETLLKSEIFSKSPGFSEAHIDELLGGEILTAPEAQKKGLVDEISSFSDFRQQWEDEKIKEKFIKKLKGRFGSGPRIAVLFFEGMILDGDNRRSPLYGQAIGDESMVKHIRELRENKKVKAVVFRINSGGGSAFASENILRELEALQEKKPLVVSMGPVAGSGGYWISMAGRRIFALPTTITGSIGVTIMFFNLSKALKKYGITSDCVKTGDSADFGSSLRPITEKEISSIDNVVGFLYEKFINRVAEARNISPEKVHEMGEGHLWLGSDAVDRGLVDEKGGLHEAISYARSLIHARKAKIIFGPVIKRPFIAKMIEEWDNSAEAGFDSLLPAMRTSAGIEKSAGICSDASGINNLAQVAENMIRHCLWINGRPLFIDPAMMFLYDR